MVSGRWLYDANIITDFESGEVIIDYASYVEPSKISFIHDIFKPILVLPFFIFYLFHYYFVVKHLSKCKFFNADKYLTIMNKLFEISQGKFKVIFEGQHDSNQIAIYSRNNFEFKYTLTGDYERFCKGFELVSDLREVNWFGKKYDREDGFYFIIKFSEIPQNGNAIIEYF